MCSCFLQLTLFRQFRTVKAKSLDLELTTVRLCLFNLDGLSSCPRPLSNDTVKMASHIYDHYELMFTCVNKVNLLSFDFQFTSYDHKMYVLITEVLTCSVHYFPQQRLTVVLALATLVSAFGSSFQYGYNVAVINSPAPVTTAKDKSKNAEGEIETL